MPAWTPLLSHKIQGFSCAFSHGPFNDLLRSPAAILSSCRRSPKKKREGHEQFTDLLRSPDTILHDCKRSHGHPGPANRARNVWQFGWQFGSNSRQFGRFSSNSGSGRRQKCGEGGNSVPQSLAFNNLKHPPRTVQRPERHSGRVFSYFAKQCVGFLEFYHAVLGVGGEDVEDVQSRRDTS